MSFPWLAFLRWKRVALAIGVVMLTLLVISGWAFFPWSDSDYTTEYPNGTAVRVETSRRYQLLPTGRWGFSRSGMIGCGDKVSIGATFTRLGFLEMTDTRTETHLPIRK